MVRKTKTPGPSASSEQGDSGQLDFIEPLDLLEEPKALSVIRTETALSRFPMHRLSKSKAIQIDLKNENGAVYWNVSHNARFGQPGPLAYKLDTLLINRRIEQAGKPLPRIIRLGSMPEIAQEMGFTTRNWEAVRQALFQNASAFITAKITYKTTEGTEKWLEAGFTRYQVILTGESLPEHGVADAVYIVLSDVYREILNTAVVRPLDYDYMKSLPPAAQRFYEIVSYQIFAAVRHGNPRARLLYSEYCKSSTATRYMDFDHVKKQMYKIHRPHIQSGYIGKVSYEATTNEAGEPDWWMYYTPGENAGKEFEAFTGIKKPPKTRKRVGESQAYPTLPLDMGTQTPTSRSQPEMQTEDLPAPDSQLNDSPQTLELVERLAAAELNRGDAERFARDRPEVCQRQLDYLPYVEEFKTSQGAYLRRAIENDFGPPTAYSKAKKEEEARKRQEAEAETKKARQSQQEARRREIILTLCHWAEQMKEEHPEAFAAFEEYIQSKREEMARSPFPKDPELRKAVQKQFDTDNKRLELFLEFFRSNRCPVADLAVWLREHRDDQVRALLAESITLGRYLSAE